MSLRISVLAALVVVASQLQAQETKYSIKVAATPVPTELSADIQKLLAKDSIQFFDPAGKAIGEFWFRAELPADATPAQIKNGLTYKEVKQSEILGAVKFDVDYRDYRKQKVRAGVYTMRLGFQPMDGDHQGSSDFQDFVVLLDAAKDTKASLMDAKAMIEASGKSIGAGHPGIFMLFPNSAPGKAPDIAAKPKHHWVINTKSAIVADGKKTGTSLGLGLTIVGAAE